MESEKYTYKAADLLDRTIGFSRNVIHLCRSVKNDDVGRVLMQQFFRSATSIGANLHEAQGAQSRNDFIAKVSISQKEAIEATYWLRLILEERLASAECAQALYQEATELAKIFSSILISSKRNARF